MVGHVIAREDLGMRPLPPIIPALVALVLALFLGLSSSIAGKADQLSDGDRAAIRQVIESQIAAFQANDDALAFSFAAPAVRDQFGNASRFMAMVKRGYMPVYRPREVEFSEILTVRGKPAQWVVVVGPDNGVFNAFYMMERQPDGSWRISGCILRPIGDRAI